MRRALGFDSGVHVGWAVLEGDGLRRPRFVRGGTLDNPSKDEVTAVLLMEQVASTEAGRRYFDGPGEGDVELLVAIEIVSGYAHEHARSAALNNASHVAGVIEGLAHAAKLGVFKATAGTWRKVVCGRANASNRAIHDSLNVLVANMPKVSNSHTRDAMGVAFMALQQSGRKT